VGVFLKQGRMTVVKLRWSRLRGGALLGGRLDEDSKSRSGNEEERECDQVNIRESPLGSGRGQKEGSGTVRQVRLVRGEVLTNLKVPTSLEGGTYGS